MTRRRGFTLIELLVVIAIIAILAAILFPVFARAREKARQTSCLSNQKQISLGVMMYVQDYDEKFPAFTMRGGSARIFMLDLMEPYTKNHQIFECPSDSFRLDTTYRQYPADTVGFYGRTWYVSYWGPNDTGSDELRAAMGGRPFWAKQASAGIRSLAMVENPAETVMLFESGSMWPESYSNLGFDADGNPRPIDDAGNVGSMRYRHNMQMNAAFADGHAKSIPQITDPTVLCID
jgi:prepilin-type N-terminal cleavage/methylation domain-containing protein/prepilin-type processing-associated H-X9-DG protein